MTTVPPERSNEQSASDEWLSEGNPNTAQPPRDHGRHPEYMGTARTIADSPAFSDRNDRADATTAKAAREHEAIVSAVHMLEKALACPAVGREAAWKRNVAPALGEVIESLRAHREAAENQGGVIAETEAVLGRPRALAVARNQHTRLTREADQLLAGLNMEDPKLSFREIRRRGWRLTSLLHDHRALEADLIMEAFERDIGGEA